MSDTAFPPLISPLTRSRLVERVGEKLVATDGDESFFIRDGIAELLVSAELVAHQRHTQEAFDTLPLAGLPYFRPAFFIDAARSLLLHAETPPRTFAELGGGEGHLARHLHDLWPGLQSCVCDLSRSSLARAPHQLCRIWCDVTRPVFAPDTLDAAAFWVSLHHLCVQEQTQAMTEIARALRPGGLLLVCEPNADFYLRKVVYSTCLAQDVYFDQEAAVDFSRLVEAATSIGLELVRWRFRNPPYNPVFVRKLAKWPVYLAAVELLHGLDRLLLRPLTTRLAEPSASNLSRHLTLYGEAIFRKRP
ncbi:MAG: class I SAM-dependent methyltransferase [Magnetococcales bacterium]|nr:class I SAM-dependent methyltransferase [Magnetococcales bacterium]